MTKGHTHWWDRSPKVPGDTRPYVALRCLCGTLPPGCAEEGTRCEDCGGTGLCDSPYAPLSIYDDGSPCRACNGTGDVPQEWKAAA